MPLQTVKIGNEKLPIYLSLFTVGGGQRVDNLGGEFAWLPEFLPAKWGKWEAVVVDWGLLIETSFLSSCCCCLSLLLLHFLLFFVLVQHLSCLANTVYVTGLNIDYVTSSRSLSWNAIRDICLNKQSNLQTQFL